MAIVKIEDKLFKTISEIAKNKNTTEDNIINGYLERCLNSENNEKYRIEEKLKKLRINHKMPYYDEIKKSNEKYSLKDIIGIGSVDFEIDPVELKKSIHFNGIEEI
ncbi:MAG: hypothetical protein LBT10_03730 [Methanobrevibacter sp.]|nr:hypothetical protein [Methanobrevibacter sp.]